MVSSNPHVRLCRFAVRGEGACYTLHFISLLHNLVHLMLSVASPPPVFCFFFHPTLIHASTGAIHPQSQFSSALARLDRHNLLQRFVVDEAHCISEYERVLSLGLSFHQRAYWEGGGHLCPIATPQPDCLPGDLFA